jgi:carbonic anhydrase/acetyltransferase-like protein (isoleucine patch superfamily)
LIKEKWYSGRGDPVPEKGQILKGEYETIPFAKLTDNIKDKDLSYLGIARKNSQLVLTINSSGEIGNKVNIQDGAIIHCTYEKTETCVGNNVSIGHLAIVHGCTIHDNVLIGMGAIVMDKAVIHSNSIIAAGAVVLEGTIVEPGSIYAGVPAKKVKETPQELVEGEINRIANNYVKYSGWFKDDSHE